MTSRLLLCVLACWGFALAQQRHSPEERYRMFEAYLARRGAEITRNALADVRNLADWNRKRPEVLRHMRYSLGLDPMPAKTPLHPRVTGVLDRPDYRVEKIVLESMPGLFVTGNLYLPKGLSAPAPAIIYVSGHSPGPWGAKVQYQHHGIWFARHGYAAFLLDTIEFGEISGIHHGTHDLGMWYWLSLGYTPAGPEVWNAIRALDYLETRPEIDTKRAAITGISGGGAITWYTAAMDERFRAAASVCATWTVGQHIALDAVQENCDCIYFPNVFQYDLSVLGALIAPRPFQILGALRDVSFPPAGYHEAYERAQRYYEIYGARDKLSLFEADSQHEDIPAFRKGADEWINRWIREDSTPFNEGTIKREAPENLTVLHDLPPHSINGQIHKRFIKTAEMRPWKTLEQWQHRRTELVAEIKDKVLRTFPATKVPFDVWKSPEGGWTSRYAKSFHVEFTTEDGIRVNGELFVPKTTGKAVPALVYLKGADDVIYPVDYDPLLPVLTNHVVLVLQPRLVDYPGITNYKLSNIKMSAALIGTTVESMQLWDLLRSIDYLVDGEGLQISEISVYGRKQMGALALYAAALDPRITRTILDDPPASHWQGPALLNILRITDLPEVAGMVAPREIVSLTSVPEAYTYTSAIYRLHGRKEAIRIAGDLGEACRAGADPRTE
ncbi:MAG TPA: acetylxylan esterase [Bryobacteraceae bacterium]|nr:acetylxylan esterase [Bryobacteraceae bacterium]